MVNDGPDADRTAAEDAVALEIRRRRLAAGLSQRALAKRAGFSRQYVSRAENPSNGLLSVNLVAVLDTALDAEGALVELWTSASVVRQVRRQDLARVHAPAGPASRPATSGTVDHPLLRAVEPTDPLTIMAKVDLTAPASGGVDWREVQQVRSLTGSLAASENLFGGGCAAVTGPAALRWAAGLLSARTRPDVRRALFEAVGNLAEVVGFIAFDIDDHATARRLFGSALWCAGQAESWTLRAAVLADVARQHMSVGDLDDALSAIEFARVREDRLTGTARAVLGVVHAQILAMIGRHADAQEAVDRADVEFAARDTSADPPWLTYYDWAEHAGSTAKALIPLDLGAGRPGLAAQRLTVAVSGQGGGYPRSRAFSAARLATLLMRVGEPHEAVATGTAALTSAGTIRSDRLDRDLQRVATACRPHRDIPAVEDLAATITAR